MAICDVCGNDYDKTFEIVTGSQRHNFDSFECAIHALAPVCLHCSCRIIGHGIEADGGFYCCANCARRAGETKARDRVKNDSDASDETRTAEIMSEDYVFRGTP